ncbi:MAG: hypothetical protein O2820_05060 [Planctomycetota bacterium]|nr:hypothetical protein [Planctomycetota bacterium]MDA1248573.1 hypothetical protein [Planctomycetota bacterium]
MKTTLNLLTAFVATSALTFFSGCGGSEEPAPLTPAAQPAAQTEEGEHGHPHPHGGHGAGPHDGTLADWGGGAYHVEFTVDHDKKESVVYVLGSDEKSPAPVKATTVLLSISDPAFQVELAASPLEGEADGLCSRFVGTHDSLGIVKEFAGTISAEVDGTPYVAEFKEEAHGTGGHSHGEDDALVWEGKPVEHAGTQLLLGHHGKHLHAGEEVEPAVSITRDGKPVTDAKVFNALVSADGKTVLAKEVPTIFEPTTKDEPAHYAQGALVIPKDVKKVAIRFRVVLAGEEAKTFDVPIKVE